MGASNLNHNIIIIISFSLFNELLFFSFSDLKLPFSFQILENDFLVWRYL